MLRVGADQAHWIWLSLRSSVDGPVPLSRRNRRPRPIKDRCGGAQNPGL